MKNPKFVVYAHMAGEEPEFYTAHETRAEAILSKIEAMADGLVAFIREEE